MAKGPYKRDPIGSNAFTDVFPHQDKYDDVIIGMKSTAIKFGEQTDVCLTCFASTMVTSLAYCGWASGQTWPFYLSLMGVGGHLANQVHFIVLLLLLLLLILLMLLMLLLLLLLLMLLLLLLLLLLL